MYKFIFMHNALKSSVIYILICIVFASCTTENSLCLEGEGVLQSVTRSVSGFTGVVNTLNARVYITSGSEFLVKVEASENIVAEIKTEIEGNNLWITSDKCLEDEQDILVYVTMPDLIELELSGSGDIIVENKFTPTSFSSLISGSGNISCYDSIITNSLESDISGSGIFNAVVISPNIDVFISGSGSAVVNGSGNDALFMVSGSGKIRAFNFLNATSEIKISGSGDIEINTTDSIEGFISGSGNLYFKNSPVIDVDLTGTGHLIYVP